MLSCKDIDELTIDIVDEKVSGPSKMHIKFHLLMCKNCRIHVKNTRILVNSLEQLGTESEPPEDLKAALSKKTDIEQS